MQKNTSKNLTGTQQHNKLSKSTKIALIYDRVNKWGGAERVLLTLHKIFPEAPLYTSIYSKKTAKWANDFKVIPSFLQKGPFLKRSHEYLAPLMPLVFESFDLNEFDIVISVTSESAKGVITTPKTKHICICLTPTRYLYSGYDEYFTNSFLKFFSRPLVWYLKKWDKVAASRPDVYVAISKTVKNRVKNIYNKDAKLIYPSIDKSFFNKTQKAEQNKKEYFLIVSRLVSYKRIDLAINAANKLEVPLIIVGEGRKRADLEKIAGPTVKFDGLIPEEKLLERYKNAKALIFPGNEDLGLTMIEAQACGTPVIAFRKGGATELVKEGVTGEFFEDQTVDSLSPVMEKFDRDKYNNENCIKNAQKFSFENFKTKLLELIQQPT